MGKSKLNRDKLKQLEERNDKLCEDIAVYQSICVGELCEEYADIITNECDIVKDNVLSILSALASEIHKIYFD